MSTTTANSTATPAYAATLVTVSCPREATSGERPVGALHLHDCLKAGIA